MAWSTATTLVALGIGSAVASAGGTALSMYGQAQQADNASRAAQYNYAVEQQNAKVNAIVAQQNAVYMQQQAAAAAQVQQNNAAALDNQALAVEAQAREEGRRMREENERIKKLQQVRYAKRGVTTEGSPLMVMMESAGILELGILDGSFKAEMDARSLRRQAEGERYEAGFSLMDEQIARFQEASAQTAFKLDLNQAKVNKMVGDSTAQGYNLSKYGTLLTGFQNAANSATSHYERNQTMQLMTPAPKKGNYTGSVGGMLY